MLASHQLHCLNHPAIAPEHVCADCGEPFCSACVVSFRKGILCGPCKNLRVRDFNRPTRLPVLALVGFLVGLAGLPLGLVVPFLGAFYFVTGQASSSAIGVGLGVGLPLPLIGLVINGWALRAFRVKPQLAGRVLAWTGLAAASVSAVWCFALGLMLAFKR